MASTQVDSHDLEIALDKILKPIAHLFVSQERLTNHKPIAAGGFGIVSKAQLRDHVGSPDSQIVAVKTLTLVQANDSWTSSEEERDEEKSIKMIRSFARELKVWCGVDHPNVLPLKGYFLDRESKVAMFITPYEPQGNLHDYLKRANVKLSDLDRLELAIDTASGLLYLHMIPICHGDIKSMNVLITGEGRAKLCDFGLAKVVENHPSGLTTAGFETAGTIMYMSHELICIPGTRRTLQTDVWAWGGVSLEIFTGKVPYELCKINPQIIAQLLAGADPAPLDSLVVSDLIRSLLQKCWEKDPTSRITMEGCHRMLLEQKFLLDRPLDALRLQLDEILKPVEHLFINQDRLTERIRISRGGYASIYQAQLRSHPGSSDFRIVAVKELIPVKDDEDGIKITRNFAREVKVWSKVDHPNVLPLQGFFLDAAAAVALFITPYEPLGNLNTYLTRETPEDDKRLDLAIDTASGLLYLHSLEPPICHGCVTSPNVLITAEGRAKLCDFGLSKIEDERTSGLTTTGFEEAGVTKYLSYELACVQGSRRSLRSDVWAWGCVSLEIFTSQTPYGWCESYMIMFLQLFQGALPAPLDTLSVSDRIKGLLRGCWEKDPITRITMSGCYAILLEEKVSFPAVEAYHPKLGEPQPQQVEDTTEPLNGQVPYVREYSEATRPEESNASSTNDSEPFLGRNIGSSSTKGKMKAWGKALFKGFK